MISIALQTNKPLSAYGALAQQIEADGFDALTVYNDMLYQPAWLPLLEIARHTSRLRVGVAAVNPFTCHPINIAGNMALIAEAAQGRAYLGLARGAWLDFVGVAPNQPVAALREALSCIHHLLSGSADPLPGMHFPLAGGDTLRWQLPHRDIPFLLGTWGPQTIRACLPQIAELKLGGSANPNVVPWARTILGTPDIGIVVGAVTVVDNDRKAARALARREVALYLPVIAELDRSLTLEPERLAGIKAAAAVYDYDRAAAFIPDDLLLRFAFAGTPDDVAAQAVALLEAGASRVEFGTPHGISAATGLQLLGKRVLPAIRSER